MNDGSEHITALGQIVPEFHFDLVARIIPGACTLAAMIWILGLLPTPCSLLQGPSWVSSAIVFIVFVACAYVAGLLLEPASIQLGKIHFRRIWISAARADSGVFWSAVQELIGGRIETDPSGLKSQDFVRIQRRLEDHLKLRSEATSRLLSKMAAESRCCQNLGTGSLVAMLFIGGKCLVIRTDFLASILEAASFFAFSLIAGLAAERRLESLIRRQLSLFALES